MSGRARTPAGAIYPIVACVGAYWLFAHGVGEAYPISPLGMFRQAMTSASRIVVRGPDGQLDEAFDYVDWHCDEALDVSAGAHPECDDPGYSAQATRIEDHVVAHASDEAVGAPIEVVRLSFHVREPGAAIEVRECSIARCTARRER